MAIRMGNNCVNCKNANDAMQCKIHEVKVSANYTCDQFDMKAEIQNERNCLTCLRFEGPTCAHPQKAAEGMLCSSWAPDTAA